MENEVEAHFLARAEGDIVRRSTTSEAYRNRLDNSLLHPSFSRRLSLKVLKSRFSLI